MVGAAEMLLRAGATEVQALFIDAVMAPGALERICAASVQRLVTTDSVRSAPDPRLQVVSVAPLLADTLVRLAGSRDRVAQASQKTLLIDPENIFVPGLAQRVCERFGIDSLPSPRAPFSITAPPMDARAIREALENKAIAYADMGVVMNGVCRRGTDNRSRPGDVAATSGGCNHESMCRISARRWSMIRGSSNPRGDRAERVPFRSARQGLPARGIMALDPLDAPTRQCVSTPIFATTS